MDRSFADAVSGTAIAYGAQNMHWEAGGAYTGEIAVADDLVEQIEKSLAEFEAQYRFVPEESD